MKANSICVFFVIFLFSCEHPLKTNRELFDQQYEANVKACVEAMTKNTGIDPLRADSICSCMLNNLFIIDSNFVKMPSDSINLLLNKNRKTIEEICKSQK